ncbi:hypothetical protein BSP36_054 [Bacillus phage BSP36]|nr:hypothetical protein BSP36_054 [Bacillus phage BSP36]
MFGLSDKELIAYRNTIHDYVLDDLSPYIIEKVVYMAPFITKDGERTPDLQFVSTLVRDVENVILLAISAMSYEYAHLQCDLDLNEKDIIERLHYKYDNFIVHKFIQKGIAFSPEIVTEIIGDAILQLPYIYVNAIEDEDFDEDSFLEERADAYSAYIDENFTEEEDDFGDY